MQSPSSSAKKHRPPNSDSNPNHSSSSPALPELNSSYYSSPSPLVHRHRPKSRAQRSLTNNNGKRKCNDSDNDVSMITKTSSSLSSLLYAARNHSPSSTKVVSFHSNSLPSTPQVDINTSLIKHKFDFLDTESKEVQFLSPDFMMYQKSFSPPSTPALLKHKLNNEIYQKSYNSKSTSTFTNLEDGVTVSGYLLLQTNEKNKSDPVSWIEVYCLLDPLSFTLSIFKSSTSKDAHKVISLSSSSNSAAVAVIYSGKKPRLTSSKDYGKSKIITLHTLELTTPSLLSTNGLSRVYLGCSQSWGGKSLLKDWVRDLSKVAATAKGRHMGIRTKYGLKTDERRRRRRRVVREEENAMIDSEGDDEDGTKTPKWMKEFSIYKLIEELTGESLYVNERNARSKKNGITSYSVSSSDSGSDSDDSSNQSENSKFEDDEQVDYDKTKIPRSISSVLNKTMKETQSLMYYHAASCYIQKHVRSYIVRKWFGFFLEKSRFVKVVKEACLNRRRVIAASFICNWYRNTKFFLTVICPIEDVYVGVKEKEVKALLKQWLRHEQTFLQSASDSTALQEKLAKILPSVIYKYAQSSQGSKLNLAGTRLIDLINPKYKGKESALGNTQCFMCGRPTRACGRLIKSLPSIVRKRSKLRAIKNLRIEMIENEDEVLALTREHTILAEIAEASLKARQCREVSECLRVLWKFEGIAVRPERLPSMLLTVETQCWSKVAQYYRLRGKGSETYAEDSARTALTISLLQYSNWRDDKKGGLGLGLDLHLFSDHPSLCVTKVHLAHVLLCGKTGGRKITEALFLMSKAEEGLEAWNAASTARDFSSSVYMMRVWKGFARCSKRWRGLCMRLRFFNLKLTARGYNDREVELRTFQKLKQESRQSCALQTLHKNATHRIAKIHNKTKAYDQFNRVFIVKVFLEWRLEAMYRNNLKIKAHQVQERSPHYLCKGAFGVMWRGWWKKERELRADVNGRKFNLRFYFYRIKLETVGRDEIERIVPVQILQNNNNAGARTDADAGDVADSDATLIQKYARRWLILRRSLFALKRTEKSVTFYLNKSRNIGAGGGVLQTSMFMFEPFLIHASFDSDSANDGNSERPPLIERMREEISSNFLFSDLPVTSLDDKHYVTTLTSSIASHKTLQITSLNIPRGHITNAYMSYTQLLSWMVENVPSREFRVTFDKLVESFLEDGNEKTRRLYLYDSTYAAISNNLPPSVSDAKRMLLCASHNTNSNSKTETESKAKRNTRGSGNSLTAVETYIPWVISAAVVRVCTRRHCNNMKIEDVHEAVLPSLSLGALHDNLKQVQAITMKENGILNLTLTTVDALKSAYMKFRDDAAVIASFQYGYLYPETRRLCNSLDRFMGKSVRKVNPAEGGGQKKYLHAIVVNFELESNQKIAEVVRGKVCEPIECAYKIKNIVELLGKRRGVYERVVECSRVWITVIIKEICDLIGECEQINSERNRNEASAVSSYSLKDYKSFSIYSRENKALSSALKSKHMQLYALTQKLTRRVNRTTVAIAQETAYLVNITDMLNNSIQACNEAMVEGKLELQNLWIERQDETEKLTALCEDERLKHFWVNADKAKGKLKANSNVLVINRQRSKLPLVNVSWNEPVKRKHRIKAHYEKLLTKQMSIKKPILTVPQRWRKVMERCKIIERSLSDLNRLVCARKPKLKYTLVVAKMGPVLSAFQSFVSSVRDENMWHCLGVVKEVESRVDSFVRICFSTLPRNAAMSEFVQCQKLELDVFELFSLLNRLNVYITSNFENRETAVTKSMRRHEKQIRVTLLSLSSDLVFRQSLAIERMNKLMNKLSSIFYRKQLRRDRAALLIQAVLALYHMKATRRSMIFEGKVVLIQSQFRRKKSKYISAALKMQKWFRHFRFTKLHLYNVVAAVRDKKRERDKEVIVTWKLKNNFNKIWDVVNDAYAYHHRKKIGLVLLQKPGILKNDDVMTVNERRRFNWAEATGGREYLNEIEACHRITKFLKMVVREAKEERCYALPTTHNTIPKTPHDAALKIQTTTRTQIERWGQTSTGENRFGTRLSHLNDFNSRRMKAAKQRRRDDGGGDGLYVGGLSLNMGLDVEVGVGGLGNVKKGDNNVTKYASKAKDKGKGKGRVLTVSKPAHAVVPMDCAMVYCGGIYSEYGREMVALERLRKLKENEERRSNIGRKGQMRQPLELSYTFFSKILPNRKDDALNPETRGSFKTKVLPSSSKPSTSVGDRIPARTSRRASFFEKFASPERRPSTSAGSENESTSGNVRERRASFFAGVIPTHERRKSVYDAAAAAEGEGEGEKKDSDGVVIIREETEMWKVDADRGG